MSHFTVAVFTKTGTKEEISSNLAKYQEADGDNLPREYVIFKDVEQEYREQFENDTRLDFYCDSHSSWGQEVTEYNYNLLSQYKIGDKLILEVLTIDMGLSYYRKDGTYKCYFRKGNKCPDDKEYIWVKVLNVIFTTHPDKDVCFNGKIHIEIINPPKTIPLKEYYNNDFEYFIKDWAGYERNSDGKIGYWENPNAKWDWWQIGGRYSNRLTNLNGYKLNSEKIKEIDFSIKEEEVKKANREWELYIEEQKPESESDKKLLENMDYKKEYYIKRYGDKKHYSYCMSRFSTYAFVFNGEWIEKGKMGWWACSDDTLESEKEYFDKLDNVIKNNPELFLTIVDCHI